MKIGVKSICDCVFDIQIPDTNSLICFYLYCHPVLLRGFGKYKTEFCAILYNIFYV